MTDSFLNDHYHRLWKDTLSQIRERGFDHDPLIDSPSDQRFGITLLFRPSHEVSNNIQHFLSKIKTIEPSHHFYPNSDIHVTVMPIISCYQGFGMGKVNPGDYINTVGSCLKELPTFSVKFKGVTASPSCLLIKGFPSDLTLEAIRNRLRAAFRDSPLEQSLDKRYPLQTAHSTVARFKQPVQAQNEILEQLEQFQDFDFGNFEVGELELVFNDWYQRKKWVQRLATFKLGEK